MIFLTISFSKKTRERDADLERFLLSDWSSFGSGNPAKKQEKKACLAARFPA
jgi:hypothetical protein